jgi:hypothetical protein
MFAFPTRRSKPMSGLMDSILSSLDPQTVSAMAQRLGTSPQQTERAIHAALPLMVGQMSRNAADPAGERSLRNALERDHASAGISDVLGGLLGGMGGMNSGSGAGGLGDLLGGLLGGGGQASPRAPAGGDLMSDGMAILGHVFGQKQERVANGVGQVSGLGRQSSSQLMAMLAPIVMAALARMMNRQGSGGLGDLLGGENNRAQQHAGAGGMMGALLDRDGDGDVDMADLMQSGDLLGGLFGRR